MVVMPLAVDGSHPKIPQLSLWGLGRVSVPALALVAIRVQGNAAHVRPGGPQIVLVDFVKRRIRTLEAPLGFHRGVDHQALKAAGVGSPRVPRDFQPPEPASDKDRVPLLKALALERVYIGTLRGSVGRGEQVSVRAQAIGRNHLDLGAFVPAHPHFGGPVEILPEINQPCSGLGSGSDRHGRETLDDPDRLDHLGLKLTFHGRQDPGLTPFF